MFWFTLKFVYITLSALVPALLAVALLTVAERKLLAGLQRRQGPIVVGAWGFLQVIADGLKLLLKDKKTICSRRSKILFFTCSVLSFTLSFGAWAIVPFSTSHLIAGVNLGILWLFALSSLKVYTIFFAGWSSNSKYALFGGLRAAAQLISYEISLGVCTLSVILLSGSVNLSEIVLSQESVFFFFPLFPISIIFFITIVAETNRPPFDMAEAESELVAGYTVEYSAVYFAFLFLAEYCSILIMSALWVIFFWGGWLPIFTYLDFMPEAAWFSLKISLLCSCFILARGVLPRYRYDQLMSLGWKFFFTFSFFFFFWLICFCYGLRLPIKKNCPKVISAHSFVTVKHNKISRVNMNICFNSTSNF